MEYMLNNGTQAIISYKDYIDNSSFFERPTGGDVEVASGLAQITEVAGKSQEWNQLVKNRDFSSGTDWASGASGNTLAFGENKATLSVGVEETSSGVIKQGISIVSGHKYMIVYEAKCSVVGNFFGGYFGSPTQFFPPANFTGERQKISVIITAASNKSNLFIGPYRNTSPSSSYFTTGDTVEFYSCNVLDLTLLCIDNLTTVAEVEAWLAKNIGLKPYYPFNEGEVLNNKMEGLESIGRNLLDPATGKARIIGAYFDVYGNYYGITGTHGTLTFTSDLGEVSTITPDSDGKFQLETPGWLDVATPSDDCAVFIWWDGTKTDFVEHEVSKAYIDVTHIYGKKDGTGELVQVFPNGMAGLPSVKDILRNEGGVAVARRRMGKVDLGTLTWVKNTNSNGIVYYVTSGLSDLVKINSMTNKYACDRFTWQGRYIYSSSTVYNRSISTTSNGINVAIVPEKEYTDAATFKAAMNGVSLYFELATEEVFTDLVYQGSDHFADGTPVTLPVNYNVDNYGIEIILPLNGSEGVITSIPEIICKYKIYAQNNVDDNLNITTAPLKAIIAYPK